MATLFWEELKRYKNIHDEADEGIVGPPNKECHWEPDINYYKRGILTLMTGLKNDPLTLPLRTSTLTLYYELGLPKTNKVPPPAASHSLPVRILSPCRRCYRSARTVIMERF